jgi:Toxin co-regulated pilus biosynthesis protein Q
MQKDMLAIVTLLMASMTLGYAQTKEEKLNRLALEVEWVRSPRAVLDLSTSKDSPQGVQIANPVEMNTSNEKEELLWSLSPADKRLSVAMARWSRIAGWQLVWEAERDFVIDSDLNLYGDYLKSIDTVMQSLANTDYPLQAKANNATKTLRINRYRDDGRR